MGKIMKRSNYRLYGIFFLITAQILVGINIVSSKQIVSNIPIFLLLTIRFTSASLIILPLHWLTPASRYSLRYHFSQLTKKDWIFMIAQGLSAGVLFNCLMLLGLHFTDANVAGIITSTLPAIIAIMSWIILGETISGKKSLCVLFATVGLAVIAWANMNTVGDSHSFWGDLLVLLSLVPEAAYYVLCKLHTNKLPVFLISATINAINVVALLPFILWQGVLPTVTGTDWGILLILGLSTALFYVFWYFGSQRVDGVMASLSTAVMPVATVILAWLFLHEQLSSLECAGMGLVLISIGIYARR